MSPVIVLLAICGVLVFTSFTQYAEGATLNFANNAGACSSSLPASFSFNPGDAQSGLPFQVTYDDHTNPIYNNAVYDTITINVKSTTQPAGIPLLLNETTKTSGIFQNSNLVFMEGSNNEFPLERGVTITLAKSDGTDPYDVTVISDSDQTGITLHLHLSSVNGTTKFFSGKMTFTSGPSGGTFLHAKLGDVVTVTDSIGGYTSSGLIIPNNNPAVGALSVNFNDIVTLSYNGITCLGSVTDELGSPGGGGGGLVVRPGFVLDAIAAIGGSPFIVVPPSFGGGFAHYSDGLTIVKPGEKYVFDISKYFQDIQDQVLTVKQPVNMTFKMYDPYNINAIIHSGLYLFPRGTDIITPNSIASIEFDKNSKLKINDPTNLFSEASVIPWTDGKYQYFTFHFTPTRSYEKMSFLARSWNDHRYSTDVIFHDAGPSIPKSNVIPIGITKYNNFHDLTLMIEKEGFKKPQIMEHIHGTTDVFSSDVGGCVYWLQDSIKHAITFVISDKEGNILYSSTEILIPNEIQPKGDYGFMKFTTKQLYRLVDPVVEQKIMEQEAIKAMKIESAQ